MTVKVYDPAESVLVIGARQATGIADDGIEIEWDEDLATLHVGLDGEIAYTRNKRVSAVLTLTLMQTSDMNDYLSSLALEFELAGTGFFPVLMTDLRGTTKVQAADCLVKKRPAIGRKKDLGQTVWDIILPKPKANAGGTVAA